MSDTKEEVYGSAEYSGGSFGYRHAEDGIYLNHFSGSWKGTVVLPRELAGYPVRGLEESALGYDCEYVGRIVIPDTLRRIDLKVFRRCTNLQGFVVEGSGGAFYEKDGMLFDAKRFLVLCPMGRSGFCAVPEGTAGIGDGAFSDCRKITVVRLPSSVGSVGDAAFENCDGIDAFVVESDSTTFCSPDGVLFSKGLDELIAYPPRKPGVCRLPRSLRIIRDGAIAKNYEVQFYCVEAGCACFSSSDGVLFDAKGERLIRYPCKGGDTEYRVPDGVRVVEANAFSFNVTLRKVDIPDSVQRIGDSAFLFCIQLQGVRIGSGVSELEAAAFMGCRKLEKLVIGDGVRHLGRHVFMLCCRLRAVELPGNVETIGGSAFSVCTMLESVKVPDSVTMIGDHAFSSCARLVSVYIGGTNAAVGEKAFSDCTGLVRVNVGAGVVNIGNGPLRHNPGFRNLAADCLWNKNLCTVDVDPANPVYCSENGVLYERACGCLLMYPAGRVESRFDVPAWVREIAPGAFAESLYLERVTLPEGLTAIGDDAFNGCVRLTRVEAPNRIGDIGKHIFDGCGNSITIKVGVFDQPCDDTDSDVRCYGTGEGGNGKGEEPVLQEGGFSYTVTEGTARIVRFPDGFTDLLLLPDTLGGYPVAAIAGSAVGWTAPQPVVFRDGEGEYVAPNGVVYDANMTEIKHVPEEIGAEFVIPASVKRIDEDAFRHCCYLSWIRVQAGNESFTGVDGMLFSADKSELLKIPSRMRGICWIPASVTKLRDEACGHCLFITAYEVDRQNKAFRSVDGILYSKDMRRLITMPNAWAGYLRIPEGVDRVDAHDVDDCIKLAGIRIPSSWTDIPDKWSLWGCDKLVAIDVDQNNARFTSLDGVLFSKDMTELIRCPPGKGGSYVIPPAVKKIGDYAFFNCRNLERVEVPPGVEKEGGDVWSGVVGEIVYLECNR